MPKLQKRVEENRASMTTSETTARKDAERSAWLKETASVDVVQRLGMPLGTTNEQVAEMKLPDKLPPASTEERQKGVQMEMAVSQLDQLAEIYDPSLVGPIAGRYIAARAFIENPLDPLTQREADMYALTNSMNNVLLYARSGAQINESEFKRFQKELPQLID